MTGRAALEVGGTHVQACRVDSRTWTVVPGSTHRAPLDSNGSADTILATMAACAQALGSLASDTLAVAIPGPFDYAAGIGRFCDVGKFDALAGVEVRAELRARLAPPPSEVTFVNDAEAFALGEWLSGSARRYQRVVAITLGSGVGSGFIDAGRIVTVGPRVPPGGHVHRLLARGQPLEATVSRRALIGAYQAMVPTAGADIDVSDIATRAASGDEAASALFLESFHLLGTVIGPWLTRFGAEALVVGGGLTRAASLIAAPLRAGLGAAGSAVPVLWSRDTEAAAAIGAVGYAAKLTGSPVINFPVYYLISIFCFIENAKRELARGRR